MLSKLFSKIIITTYIISVICVIPHGANADSIYRWTDEEGKIHFTDNPALIPKEGVVDVEIIQKLKESDSEDKTDSSPPTPEPSDDEDNSDEEDLESDREQAIREYWRSRALEIDNQEQGILQHISITKNQITYKKREVDYMLSSGYFADRSIFELRYLEDRLKQLESDLELIKPEREKLQEEARRAGVPPGYLRP